LFRLPAKVIPADVTRTAAPSTAIRRKAVRGEPSSDGGPPVFGSELGSGVPVAGFGVAVCGNAVGDGVGVGELVMTGVGDGV
jgi:hypothetical protein